MQYPPRHRASSHLGHSTHTHTQLQCTQRITCKKACSEAGSLWLKRRKWGARQRKQLSAGASTANGHIEPSAKKTPPAHTTSAPRFAHSTRASGNTPFKQYTLVHPTTHTSSSRRTYKGEGKQCKNAAETAAATTQPAAGRPCPTTTQPPTAAMPQQQQQRQQTTTNRRRPPPPPKQGVTMLHAAGVQQASQSTGTAFVRVSSSDR